MGGCEEGSRSLTSPTMPPIARCRACTAASADGAAAAERVGSSDARDASWPALLVILVTLAAGDIPAAQTAKEMLENLQRADAKLRKGGGA